VDGCCFNQQGVCTAVSWLDGHRAVICLWQCSIVSVDSGLVRPHLKHQAARHSHLPHGSAAPCAVGVCAVRPFEVEAVRRPQTILTKHGGCPNRRRRAAPRAGVP
jgi:hypothetical protein